MAKPLLALVIVFLAGTAGCAGRWTGSPPSALDSPPVYRLTLRIRPDDHRLEVSGTVRISAADTIRTDLRLSLSERMRELRVEVMEPSVSAGLAKLERVSGNGSGSSVKWILRPTRPIPPGQSVVLRFSYTGGGEVTRMYYIGPELAFASAWGTDWYPLVNSASDKGTGDLTVAVPAGWNVVTGGARRSSAEEEAQGTFRFAILHPTYFSFTAGNYAVVRHDGAVPLSAYLLTHRDHIESYLGGVDAILRALIAEFGTYPFDELVLVEVPRELASQAGFNAFATPGLMVMNSRAFDAPEVKYLLEWLGHEISHQWFPHVVALRTPPGLYMEEALAEYGGLRTVETIAGPEAARRMRVSGFEFDPIYSAAAYFKSVGAGVDQPLADLQPSLEHRNLAYNKGSLIFDMLSREIGRDKFQRILHEITRRHRFQSITWHEFVNTIAADSSRNLDWFFDQWFGRTGAPDFRLSWSQEGDTLRGVITQPAPFYRAHLKVEMRDHGDQRLVRVVEISGARADFVVRASFRVQSAVLDPDFEVLRWTPEYRAAADTARSKRDQRR